jgi:hypothetical protein
MAHAWKACWGQPLAGSNPASSAVAKVRPMSMLTPLGRGGGLSFRRRRRWPRVLAVLIVIALIGSAGVAAWWWFTQRDEKSATANPGGTCVTPTPTVAKKLPRPQDVRVAVFNGTDEVGLASSTAEALRQRGFDVVDVGDTRKPVGRGTAQVRYSPDALASAVVLASFFPNSHLFANDKSPGKTVHVWLGPNFDAVVASARANTKDVTPPPGEPKCGNQKAKKK